MSTAEIALLRGSTPGAVGRIDVAAGSRFTYGTANGDHFVNDTIVGGLISFTSGLADTTFVTSDVFTVDTINVRAGAVQFNMLDTAVALGLDIGLGGVGGHLSGTGVVRVTTNGTWTGGSIGSNLGGTVHLDVGATWNIFSSQNRTFDGHNIVNDGTILWPAIGAVNGQNGASIDNRLNALVDITSTGTSTYDDNALGAAPIFQNDGTVQKTGTGGFHVFAADFLNGLSGVVDIQTGTMIWQGSFDHGLSADLRGDGTADLSAATITTFDGNVSPGASPGVLGYVGTFAAGAVSTYTAELDGTTPGSGATFHDQLNINGAFNGGGVLGVVIDVNYTPAAGDSLIIMTYTSRAGGNANFATVNLPVVAGLSADTVWTATDLAVVFTSTAPPNLNQWLGGVDLNWATDGNWSKGTAPGPGDSVVIDPDLRGNPLEAKADGRNRRSADLVAHHEDLRSLRMPQVRRLPRLQGLRDQGVLCQLRAARRQRDDRPPGSRSPHGRSTDLGPAVGQHDHRYDHR